jgi:transcriptional regulator with PAS, ATPase and Fis domain
VPLKTFDTTVEDVERGKTREEEPVPGVVLIWSGTRPMMQPMPLVRGELELGRELLADDDRISRKHVRLAFDGRRWTVEDLGSRNGSYLEGLRIQGETVRDAPPRTLRIGRSIFLFDENVRRFELGIETDKDGMIIGPKLRAAQAAIERAAMFGETLFIRGESGSGKELAARSFHAFGGREAEPFVAVNCAAIPEGLAERLLFGAKKGAYSGATADADGYISAANGGALFLDEIAELDPAVQAKLLRVLETKEVLALGDSMPRRVELRVCSATHKSLREEVAKGRFREDLYFRIGRPEIAIPPLRERPEEIPWLIHKELEKFGGKFSAHVGFLETCLLRKWPGNVRELSAETRRAVQEAVAASREIVEAVDLSPSAGAGFEVGGVDLAEEHALREMNAENDTGSMSPVRRASLPEREAIEDALKIEAGNVTRAAKRLGLHRNQLRRWLEKNAVDPKMIDDN